MVDLQFGERLPPIAVDELRDDQWERLKDLIPCGREGRPGRRAKNRLFLNALIWIAKTGRRWNDLPPRLGDPQAAMRRYYRWMETGSIHGIFPALMREAGIEGVTLPLKPKPRRRRTAGARSLPRSRAGHPVDGWDCPARGYPLRSFSSATLGKPYFPSTRSMPSMITSCGLRSCVFAMSRIFRYAALGT